ncbi:MAG: AAA family ATPase, partial [Clostridia bacterium]|nr:AAA family ATPase [Clostridia bacterium]
MQNIILIGMPGSGKSTLGVLLAKIAGFSFLDSDLLIQSKVGKKLYSILDEDGADYFKSVENEVNSLLDVANT